MFSQVRIMLYVDDVAQISHFWQEQVGALVVAETVMPDHSKQVVLRIAPGVELNLFAKSFIRAYSPEVVDNQPSLMFFIAPDQFADLHQRLAPKASLTQAPGSVSFNFADPEGHYFVVATRPAEMPHAAR